MSDKKPFTVCAAFIDSDNRATFKVYAKDYAAACAIAIQMVNDGEVETRQESWDPDPTFIYGIVEGDDGDPWTGCANVPADYTHEGVMRGDGFDDIVDAAVERRLNDSIASVMEEHEDKIIRRLIAPMVDALVAGRNALKEAIGAHIYDEANGERPESGCRYVAAINLMDAAIARGGVSTGGAELLDVARSFEPWERRGSAIYTEGDAAIAGSSLLVCDLHGLHGAIAAADALVAAHNAGGSPVQPTEPNSIAGV